MCVCVCGGGGGGDIYSLLVFLNFSLCSILHVSDFITLHVHEFYISFYIQSCFVLVGLSFIYLFCNLKTLDSEPLLL